jgi:structural maintenance of chromosome 3 (chondroitin sulfate proteoglycan 6)
MSISLHQDEGERNDLLRDKTEVECIIEDFAQSSENGETRRLEVTEQLASIDKRVGKASERLMDLSLQLEQRTAEERQAKEL